MKYIIFITLISIGLHTSAQEYKYAKLTCLAKAFSTKVQAALDSGENDFIDIQYIKDENGDNKVFKSPIQAVNYVSNLGWELVFVLPETQAMERPMYHYYFRKKK